MTPYDPTIVASSTAVVLGGVQYLFTTVWSFVPIVLTVVVPLGIMYGVYRLIKGKSTIH